MVIRKYEATDRKSCIDIFKSNTPLYFTLQELTEFEGWLDQEMQEENTDTAIYAYYVLEEENTMIACGGFYLDTLLSQATLTWGMVASKWHRKGVGKKLLDYRIQNIKTLDPKATVYLDTTQHSYQFFENLGFVVTQITTNYYAEGVNRYDMVLIPDGSMASKRSADPGDLPDD